VEMSPAAARHRKDEGLHGKKRLVAALVANIRRKKIEARQKRRRLEEFQFCGEIC